MYAEANMGHPSRGSHSFGRADPVTKTAEEMDGCPSIRKKALSRAKIS
jgi:hypothetical protein